MNAIERSSLALTGAALLLATASVQSQGTWPARQGRLIVPAPVGSAPDLLSRLFAQRLTEMWGQSVIIDNIQGANGNIGIDRVAKAAPDGYTLLFNTIGPIAVNQSLFGKLPYNQLKYLAPITLVTTTPNILYLHPSVPERSVKELIALSLPGVSWRRRIRLGRSAW